MTFRLPAPLVEALAGVRSVGAITGAGISAECGLPTYRGRGGLYEDPVDGERAEEALGASMLARSPETTWRVLARLARSARGVAPGAAHRALAELEARGVPVTVLTQNVDGLHQRAGSRDVIEIHGNVFRSRCLSCEATDALDLAARVAAGEGPPACSACGGATRPAVVLFGERLPEEAVARMLAAFGPRPPDLVLSVGTTSLFPYVVQPLLDARAAGALTVEVNPEPTPVSEAVGWRLPVPAGTALPPLLSALGGA